MIWDLKTLKRINKAPVRSDHPSLELDLYQSKPLIRRARKDPEGFAPDLYRALCNVTWKHRESGNRFACSWRYAGGIVSTMAYSVDDYMRYYSSGNEGTVTDDVLTELDKLGWEPTEDEDERT